MFKVADLLSSQLGYASDVANKPTVVKNLLKLAGTRVRKLAGVFVFFSSIRENAGDIKRLLEAYYEGKYKELPWATIVKAVLGIMYFVSFVDLIPDFIPAIGLLDDFVVIGWVVNSIREDLDKFMAWEKSQSIEIHEPIHGDTQG
ncbi:hypothetical protein BH09BAC1_BH09BAC1_11560 [soil metagenome]